MKRNFTCIVCPNGCEIEAEYERQDNGKIRVLQVRGNTCRRGEEYATQELTAPKRTIASSVFVTNGTMPLASVRLNRPIPKERIFDVMEQIRAVHLKAPVCAGQIVIRNVLGLGSDVIATRDVPEAGTGAE